jgi:hypothetical protein
MKNLFLSFISLAILAIMFSCSTGTEKYSRLGRKCHSLSKKGVERVQGKNPGRINPDFIGQPKAPDGAPNVLVIMLDDAGYSNATSFGG